MSEVFIGSGVFSMVSKLIGFFAKEKFKAEILYSESYISTYQNNNYAIIKVNLINPTAYPINKLRITTIPNYTFSPSIQKLISGERFIPFYADLIKDVIDAKNQISINTKDNLEGNLIVNIGSLNNRIDFIKFKYLNKTIKKKIKFDNLARKEI